MTTERVERKLAAILSADVVSYSRLMGTDEEGTLARLKAADRGRARLAGIAEPRTPSARAVKTGTGARGRRP
jgi:hypothetical protein